MVTVLLYNHNMINYYIVLYIIINIIIIIITHTLFNEIYLVLSNSNHVLFMFYVM